MAEYESLHALSDCEIDLEDRVAQKVRDGCALEPAEVVTLRRALERPQWRVRSRGRSVRPPKGEFALERLGTESSPQKTDVGYRYYVWVP
jgi:hypothetical protein